MKSFKQHINEQWMFRKRPDEIPQIFGPQGVGPQYGDERGGVGHCRSDHCPEPRPPEPCSNPDECVSEPNIHPCEPYPACLPCQPWPECIETEEIDVQTSSGFKRPGQDPTGCIWGVSAEGDCIEVPEEPPDEVIKWELEDPYSFRGITNDYGLLYNNRQNNKYNT